MQAMNAAATLRGAEVLCCEIGAAALTESVLAMIERSADAWYIIVRAANVDYKALTFYLQEQPTLLTDLLTALNFTLKIEEFHPSCHYSSLVGQFIGI